MFTNRLEQWNQYFVAALTGAASQQTCHYLTVVALAAATADHAIEEANRRAQGIGWGDDQTQAPVSGDIESPTKEKRK